MICTLIKNDSVLIEPFLLTSPSEGKAEAESRGCKMGQGPTAGHSQPSLSPQRGAHRGGTEWLGVGGCEEVDWNTPLNFKDSHSCRWCSLRFQELGGRHQAPWIPTHAWH